VALVMLQTPNAFIQKVSACLTPSQKKKSKELVREGNKLASRRNRNIEDEMSRVVLIDNNNTHFTSTKFKTF